MPNCLVPSAQDKSKGPASPRARLRLCPRLPIVLCLQHKIHAEGRKLCRPYRAECFIRGLIPGAAPDGLPQAIELSCAFSADLVSRTPRWERRASSPARCSCGKHEEQKESYVRPLVRQHCRSLTKSGIPPTTRKSALQPRATNPSALQALYNPK